MNLYHNLVTYWPLDLRRIASFLRVLVLRIYICCELSIAKHRHETPLDKGTLPVAACEYVPEYSICACITFNKWWVHTFSTSRTDSYLLLSFASRINPRVIFTPKPVFLLHSCHCQNILIFAALMQSKTNELNSFVLYFLFKILYLIGGIISDIVVVQRNIRRNCLTTEHSF